MKTNIIYPFALLLALICKPELLNAQYDGDHLEPVGGLFDVYDFQFEYYSKVRKVLFNGLTDAPEIRFQVMPSFTPENVLDIELDREANQYYLVFHTCEEMIWYHEEWKKVKVKKYKTSIDKKSVDLIKSLFEVAISQTKFRGEGLVGLDGTYYYFSIRKYGMNSGRVWSPLDKSKMGKLVGIGLELIELATSKQSSVKIEGALQQKIEKLINEL
jgi:hypothetical protein